MLSKFSAGAWWAWMSNPLKVVPLLAAVLGLMMVFLAPPLGRVPDEPYHFYRAVGISQGHIWAERLQGQDGLELGGYIPRSLQKLTAPLLHSKLDFDKTIWQRFDGSAVYSPVPYVPQVLGVLTGRLLDLPPFGLFYLTRLFNLAAWVAMVYAAIRIAPRWGWATGAVALLPITVFQSGTVTADVMTVGLSMLLVAQVVRAATEPGALSRREYSWLVATAAALALTKPPLALLPLAAMAIPRRRYGSTRRWLAGLAGIVLPGLLLVAAWSATVGRANVTQGFVEAHPMAQVQAIVHDPWIFPQAMLNLHFVDSDRSFQLIASATTPAGWLGIPTYLWVVMVSYAVLTLAILALVEPEPALARPGQRWAFLGTWAVVVAATEGVLYLYFSEVGGRVVNGVQGRYFIPMLLLLPFALRSKGLFVQTSRKTLSLLVVGGSLLAVAALVAVLLEGYPLHFDYFSRVCTQWCQP